ncbi:MAG: hypothetical protein ACR2IE_12980 [Candidatus Sumerlaeaceae bacterium]
MLVVAFLHIGFLLAGALLLAYGAARKHWMAILPGSLLLAFALWCMLYFFPFDWLMPARRTVAEYKLDTYTIRFGQQPSSDFYETYLEIIRPDGLKAVRWVDSDGDKIWRPSIEKVGSRIYFCRLGYSRTNSYTPWVDSGTSEVYTRLGGAQPIEAMDYK